MDNPRARIDMSRRTLDGWEAMGGPGGRFRDTMAMIREELAILRAIAEDHPELAEDVAGLEERYGRLALRMTFAN